jgi:serine/threonine-protein kinase
VDNKPLTTTTLRAAVGAANAARRQFPDPHTRELVNRYWQILESQRISWTEHHHLIRLLGSGGHGYVYLSEGRGTDDFVLPVALKIFSPERYQSCADYNAAMQRLARVSAKVARIQQDNIVHVQHWVDRGWVRVMEMEWIDGFDLRRLLTRSMLERLRKHVSADRFEQINRVVVTQGPDQPRLRPGVAMAIVRDCLAALDALHRAGIVHADIKPSNVMLKRTGSTKLIDIGSAFEVCDRPTSQSCTLLYAAPEILERNEWTPQSDLASLGYTLIEVLSGRRLFEGRKGLAALEKAKRELPGQLPQLLPEEAARNELLLGFCRRLIAVDPAERFVSAEEAELDQGGAAGFHRQLVKGDLSSEYETEIRRWLTDLGPAIP